MKTLNAKRRRNEWSCAALTQTATSSHRTTSSQTDVVHDDTTAEVVTDADEDVDNLVASTPHGANAGRVGDEERDCGCPTEGAKKLVRWLVIGHSLETCSTAVRSQRRSVNSRRTDACSWKMSRSLLRTKALPSFPCNESRKVKVALMTCWV